MQLCKSDWHLRPSLLSSRRFCIVFALQFCPSSESQAHCRHCKKKQPARFCSCQAVAMFLPVVAFKSTSSHIYPSIIPIISQYNPEYMNNIPRSIVDWRVHVFLLTHVSSLLLTVRPSAVPTLAGLSDDVSAQSSSNITR